MDGLHANAGWAAYVAHGLIVALLVASIALSCARRVDVAIKLIAAQAFLLAVICVSLAVAREVPQLFIVGGVALLFNAAAVPIALRRYLHSAAGDERIESALGIGPMLCAVIGMIALSLLVFHDAGAGDPGGGVSASAPNTLAIACSLVLIGLLNLTAHANSTANVVAILSIENGAILAMISIEKMPRLVEFSIGSGVLVGSLLVGLHMLRDGNRRDTPRAGIFDRNGDGGS